MRRMMATKAIGLASFVRWLLDVKAISTSEARNALDRLALRMDQAGESTAEEIISAEYMRVA